MAEKLPKKYRILVDPPLDINKRGNYGAIKHYPLMTLDEIKKMPIAQLADEDSHPRQTDS